MSSSSDITLGPRKTRSYTKGTWGTVKDQRSSTYPRGSALPLSQEIFAPESLGSSSSVTHVILNTCL